MGNKGLLKRMLPFFATFAVGIFIASFFVNIGGSERYDYRDHRRCHREIQQLQEENLRLQDQLDSMHGERMNLKHNEDWESPSVDEPVLSPPPPPRSVRAHRLTAK